MSDVTFQTTIGSGHSFMRCNACGATLQYGFKSQGDLDMLAVMDLHYLWHAEVDGNHSSSAVWAVVMLLLIGWGAFLFFASVLVNGWPK